ncbi:ATP-binding cassette domain-containing protein [Kouleothrix sp.]|uniref:ATP-binding cassette domain-containing protein n=1 Tax=Kouleothrix sp. TaxID=2779161 RepID=UPI0039199B6F
MSILLEQLSKRYDGHPVVHSVSLEIADGEFFVLLGPSGSGKSTILRMIAGLSSIDHGRVVLRGRDVTRLQPQERGVGFVFQNYALFRHMSVAENVEFGLKIRKIAPAERRRRRDELLELVGLAGLGARMPRQLSGGQQQRVALARALAYAPEVLLLDEPFGALDAKIRVELRRNLRRIQREIGTTTIFVTHDQEEAFELGDRLGVMNVGRLLEVGPPEELYQHPQTEFVATFLGTANLLVGRCTDDGVLVGTLHFPLSTAARPGNGDRRVQVLFRPEDIALAPSAEELAGPTLGAAEVEQITFAGSFERLRLRLPPIAGVRPIAPEVPYGSDAVLLEATRSQDQARGFPLAPGARVWVGVRRMHALAHPGLRMLLLTDGTPATQPALELGAQLARLAHARTTILGYSRENSPAFGQQMQQIRESLGSGLPALETRQADLPAIPAALAEVERQSYDLAVLSSHQAGDLDLAAQLLQRGDQHLLLVPDAQTLPERVLICVAAGEPGKDDVLFAGRLLRHFGAAAGVLSVLRAAAAPAEHERAERFIAAGVRTLALLGVPAHSVLRQGAVIEQIAAEMAAGGYDMLVLGAPPPRDDGRAVLAGVVGEILSAMTARPVLLVRSASVARRRWHIVSRQSIDMQEINR